MMRHLTTVLFLVVALLFAALPAGATPPVFNGNLISGTTPMFNALYYSSLQAALTAASAAGGCVYVPASDTRDQSISATVTGDNTTCIVGDAGRSIIGGSANPLLSISYNQTTGQNLPGPRIVNLTIVPSGSNGALKIQNTGGNVGNNTRLVVLSGDVFDIRNEGTAQTAVLLIGVSPFVVTNSNFRGAKVTGDFGLRAESSVGNVIGSNFYDFDSCFQSDTFSTYGFPEVSLQNNYLRTCGTAISDGSIEDLISGNIVESSTASCLTENGSGVNEIVGNTFNFTAASNAGLYCVNVGNTGPVTFTNNNVYVNSAGNGLVSYAPNASPVVGGFIFTNNVLTYTGTATYGLNLGPGMGRGNLVEGNLFNNGTGFSGAAIAWSATAMTAANGYVPGLILRDNVGVPNNPRYPPGNVACPTVASGAWEWNDQPYTITEYISGGTVSQIQQAGPNNSGGATAGVTLGFTSGTVVLAPGDAIGLTYSVAPSVVCTAH